MAENEHTGSVRGAVVQAGRIDGGVHVHQPSPEEIRPRQLPGVTWHFTGRATELAELTKALDNAVGAVVISPSEPIGGIGTTSLAVRWATEFAARFPDGALYVNLRGSDPLSGRSVTPDQVVRGFLDSFGIAVPQGVDAQFGMYRSVLASRRMLLLIDDARDAAQVLPLLPGNTGCFVVVTCRRPLPDLVATAGAKPITLPPLPDAEARDLLRRHIGDERTTNQPDSVADLITASGGVPFALNIIAAHTAARPDMPLADMVDQLHVERDWLHVKGDGLADRTQVVYSWARQQADTTPIPKQNLSAGARSAIAWARRPEALLIVVAAVIAAYVGVSIPQIRLSGIVGLLYLLLRVAVLVGAVLLQRRPDRQAIGVGFAAAMAVYLLGDSMSNLYNVGNVWQWLYLLATLAYLGVLTARFWPFHEVRSRPRFVTPANRPLAIAVLGGVFAQLVLPFVAIPYNCLDFLGDSSACTFTVTRVNGALGTLLFVGPIAALCVLVAITEPPAEPRRSFVIATVVAFFGPELYFMLASLLLGSSYTYVGDDVSGQQITAIWFVILNAAVFVVIAGGTTLLALNRGVRAR